MTDLVTDATSAASSGPAAPAPAAAPPQVVVSTLPSLNPPLFFEIVEDQVYRSNKCDASSFPFLATLELNTVVYLSYDDLSRDLAAFFAEKEINVVRILLLLHLHGVSPSAELDFDGGLRGQMLAEKIHLGMKYRTASSQWKGISEGMAKEAIECILDQRRHPILVMCKYDSLFLPSYRNIAGSVKTRFENEQFIELFDVDLVTLPQQLPLWFTVHQQLMVRHLEEERIALTKCEFFPGRTLEQLKSEAAVQAKETESKEEGEEQPEHDTASLAVAAPAIPAYQQYYFYLQGPLVSASVKFSEKKSIIGDDDDD
ncbi:hypothetical protein BBJ28_00006554 [Nothophytophthora sp. Chile5]|nr:hypothetical protein BBJ28_00006554 [Nothophytophthora sp. Chile5]